MVVIRLSNRQDVARNDEIRANALIEDLADYKSRETRMGGLANPFRIKTHFGVAPPFPRFLREGGLWTDSITVSDREKTGYRRVQFTRLPPILFAQTLWYPIMDHRGRWLRRLMEDQDDRTTPLGADGGEMHR